MPDTCPLAATSPDSFGVSAASSASATVQSSSSTPARSVPFAATCSARPFTVAWSRVMSAPSSTACADSVPPSPISAGTGASPPVIATVPSSPIRIGGGAALLSPEAAGRDAVASSAAWPWMSTPPAAASGASAGSTRCTAAARSPPVLAVPRASSSGCDSVNATGRAGSSSCASAVSSSGAASSSSGFGPGTRSPVALALRPTWPRSPATSASSRPSDAPPALTPATSRWPVASGVANGPRLRACSDTPCQDRPGAGFIAGAVALSARSALRLARSSVPCASARSSPARSASTVASAVRGPDSAACSVSAPRSGRCATLDARPSGGSSASSVAWSEPGPMRPLAL